MEQANQRTLHWLAKGKIGAKWVEANQLKRGDYVAQVIPKEVVVVPEFTEEDARLYGILLAMDIYPKREDSGAFQAIPKVDTHLQFVERLFKSTKYPFLGNTTGRYLHSNSLVFGPRRRSRRHYRALCFCRGAYPSL